MEPDFRRIAESHTRRYPEMRPRDYVKLAWQSEFGPAHLLANPDGALPALLDEWRQIPPSAHVRAAEPIGNGLCRLHLDGSARPEECAPFLARLLQRTVEEHTGTQAGLERRLELLRTLELPGMDRWLPPYLASGCPPVRHSPAFRRAYRPHYRVLREEYARFFPALLAVDRLLDRKQGAPALIAIDGRCGSGKSTLAALLERLFPCRVIHMDDFYLPPARRNPGREQCPGGNMDFSRLAREVLEPAGAGHTVAYRPFSCRTGQPEAVVELPPAPLTVVEGSYSLHPALGARYDLTLFLTCSPQVQLHRLARREGANLAAFQRLWIPMEERYYQALHIPSRSALSLNTDFTDD